MAGLTQDDLPAARRFLEHFNTAAKRVQLLPAEHPYVAGALAELKQAVKDLCADRQEFTFSIAEGEVYLDGLFLAEESLKYANLLGSLEPRGLTSLTFGAPTDDADLAGLLSLSIAKQESLDLEGDLETALARKGVRNIRVGQYAVSVPGAQGGLVDAEGRPVVPRDVYRAVVQVVVETFIAASNKDSLNISVVDGMVQLLMTAVVRKRDIALGLNTMKSLNEYTFYHSVNVAILSLLMGAKIGLDERQLQKLGMAALLHDIGKTRIPDEILSKTGRLSDQEFEIMRNHTTEGLKILAGQDGVDELAPIIAVQHHAHYNLSGYPDFKGLGDLHILSHLVTVADVYDAVTSDRCYRGAMLPDRAMQIIIEGRCVLFHPLFTKVFVELAGMFPVGTLVQLDSGHLAVVVGPNPHDIYRPSVQLVGHGAVPDESAERIDTSEKGPDGQYLHTILRSVQPHDVEVDLPRLV